MCDSLPPAAPPEIRGQVSFVEDLSWHHSTGHSVRAGDLGTVAWQFGDRLAIWSGGVLLHSVPLDCVESI